MSNKPIVNKVSAQAENIAFQVNKALDTLADAIAERFKEDGSFPILGDVDMNGYDLKNIGELALITLDLRGTVVSVSEASEDNDPVAYSQLLSLEDELDTETASRIANDNALSSRITTNYNSILEEVNSRENAIANLQSQITGETPLEASAFSPISWHDQTIDNSVIIPDNKNAWSFGPVVTISSGQTVTVGTDSYWTIADGEVV